MQNAMFGKSLPWFLGLIVVATAMILLATMGAGNLQPTIVVPEEYAEKRGAESWSKEQKNAFRKHVGNHWMLSEADLKDRSGRGPQVWLPPGDQCLYLSRFVATLERFGLDRDATEMQQLKVQRQRCYTQFQ